MADHESDRRVVPGTGAAEADTGTAGEAPPPVPNQVLTELRKACRWGRTRLARDLHAFCLSRGWPHPGEANIAKQIYRLEKGHIRSPDEFYTRLYCQFFRRSPHDLFGETRPLKATAPAFELTSHNFVPAYVGAQAAAELILTTQATAAAGQWTDCHTSPVADDHPDTGLPF